MSALKNTRGVSDSVVERPPVDQASPSNHEDTATRWALGMIPATLLGAVVAYVVGNLLMHATGTPEGALLTSSGLAGWVSWVAVLVLMMSAPIAGVVLALVGRRRQRSRRSDAALVVNAAIGGWFLVSAIANVVA
ncbi:MAG: hypothetical protein KGJ36_08340 [Acidobacteriota bacterium]|nr:hypothetical protein [Acidobacteriota bacterium]